MREKEDSYGLPSSIGEGDWFWLLVGGTSLRKQCECECECEVVRGRNECQKRMDGSTWSHKGGEAVDEWEKNRRAWV